MGREAQTTLIHQGQAFAVKALLEADCVIIRGDFKIKLLRDDMSVTSENGDLLIEDPRGLFILKLGEAEAAKWHKKLTTPAPSLSEKLGLSQTHKAYIWADAISEDLQAAFKTHGCERPQDAAFLIGIVDTKDALNALLHKIKDFQDKHVWCLYPKGPKSTLPESVVRTILYEHDYRDSKSCAVNETYTATRFKKAS